MILTVNTEPTVEPLTSANVKYHLRIEQTDSDYDTTITNLIKAVRQWTENYLNRALMTQTLDYYMDRFPSGDYYMLPRPPLQTISTLQYTDYNGDADTLTEGTEFEKDTDSEPGRIVLNYDYTWPTDTLHPKNPILTRYVAGYSVNSPPTADEVPMAIRQAMLMLLTHWFNQRQPISMGVSLTEIPMTVKSLLAPYRVYWY